MLCFYKSAFCISSFLLFSLHIWLCECDSLKRNVKKPSPVVNFISGSRVSVQGRVRKNSSPERRWLSPGSSAVSSVVTEKESSQTPLLDTVTFPSDIKSFNLKELKQLCSELRVDLINKISRIGGHFGSSLGVIELTTALHHVFDTPEDNIMWDVSHQAYPHKMLTGRRNRMLSIRKRDGLSGFCKRSETPHDCFGAGHSSTSISAVQGMAVARQLMGAKPNHNIAVIGDGAITAGMAYEAMNSCGFLKTPLLVILNDNGQVSLPTGMQSAGGTRPAGALSDYMARLLTSRGYMNFREIAKGFSNLFPEPLKEAAAKIDEYSRGMVTGGTLFEELGFYYVGVVNGHDLEALLNVLGNLKSARLNKSVLLHIKTEKGYGYLPAMAASDKMHGVLSFDVATGKPIAKDGSCSKTETFTCVFSSELSRIASHDESVVAITAAMPGGTGVGAFGKLFPTRTFDVGIAEQHAVTFGAGMACEGAKPFCCIYSTFLQRGYDQVVHDVVLQNLPVRFILDRAGLVGADGATHHGSFDLAYLGTLPGIVIMAPSDEVELRNMIQTAYSIDDRPSAVRYPRADVYGFEILNSKLGYNLTSIPTEGVSIPIGQGRIIRDAPEFAKNRIAVLSLGTRLLSVIEAVEQIEREDPSIGVSVYDMRFAKPLDHDLIKKAVADHDAVLTIEEGAIGGFGSHVHQYIFENGLIDSKKMKIRSMFLPDFFIENANQLEQYQEAKLDTPHILKMFKILAGRD